MMHIQELKIWRENNLSPISGDQRVFASKANISAFPLGDIVSSDVLSQEDCEKIFKSVAGNISIKIKELGELNTPPEPTNPDHAVIVCMNGLGETDFIMHSTSNNIVCSWECSSEAQQVLSDFLKKYAPKT